jgi:hypothetical protein
LVDAHSVAVGKPEYVGYSVCIEEVVHINFAAHRNQITAVGGSVRPVR